MSCAAASRAAGAPWGHCSCICALPGSCGLRDGGGAVGALFLLDLQLAAWWAPHNIPEMGETSLQALKLLGASPFCGTLPE